MSGSGPWDKTPVAPPPPPPAPDGAPPGPIAIKATDFLAAQRANKRNTWLLIVILLLLGGALGYVGGALIESYSYSRFGPSAQVEPDSYSYSGRSALTAISAFGVIGGGALISIGLIASGVTFAFGGRLMLGLAGAREVTADEEPMLHNVVEEMAIAAGLPKPKIAVIETDVPNAFATGMDPQNAAIGVTRGLLTKLNRDELQGVIGHEMGHILNMDTRYMTAVAILVGLIALVCDVARRMMWYGAASGGQRRDREKGGGNVALLVIFVVFAILAPIAAQLVRFAVSRQREYLADATSVRLTRNPVGLIGALEKLAAEQRPFDGANRATQHMFIVNPFKVFGANSTALFSTHPPLEQRIQRLQNLGIL
ncbi:MAG TPA: M48 family metallopeptidase [Candidatus Angelobacter sp.]|nr:M48 family metallopeptidase [Candidatus Angelobacter sp.]